MALRISNRGLYLIRVPRCDGIPRKYIPNGYCLDDELVVDNEMVKKGIGGLKEIFITN